MNPTNTKISLLCLFLAQFTFSQSSDSYPEFNLENDTKSNLFYWGYTKVNTTPQGNDTTWQVMTLKELIALKKPQKSAGKIIRLSGTRKKNDFLIVYLWNIPSAYKVYWDNVYLGSNGIVGDDNTIESPGFMARTFLIDNDLISDGLHFIRLEISNYANNYNDEDPQFILTYNLPYAANHDQFNQKQIIPIGLYFCIFLITITLYLSGWRNISYLILSLYAILKFSDALYQYLLELNFITTTFFTRLSPYHGFITQDIPILILAFFLLWYFDTTNKKYYILFLLILFSIVRFLIKLPDEFLDFWLLRGVFYGYSVIFILLNIRRKIPGTYLLLIAFSLVLSLAIYLFLYVFAGVPYILGFYSSFLIYILMISLIIIAVSVKIQDQNRKYEQTLLRSNRLENEMLKKSIQPHFIMNTLFSLKSTLGHDTSKAEDLIDALADQFRIINEISSKKCIPLDEEITLCKLHLELMGYRFEGKYKMEINGIIDNIKIPPLILHTLIENAFTHAYLPKENGSFNLDVIETNNSVILKMVNDGSQLNSLAQKENAELEEGMGLKYVRARLEEVYSNRWELNYGLNHDKWEVIITIKKSGNS